MGKIIDSPDLIETGNRIRIARQKANFTQEKLADAMEVSWNTVHRIEYAQAAMSIDKLFQIADILHVPLLTLCPSRFEPPPNKQIPTMQLSYERLSDKNKCVVKDTLNVLISGLLSQQEKM